MLFSIIEGAQAIVMNKGVYRQCKLYERGGEVYAGWGSGFIKLYGQGRTSLPNARLLDHELTDQIAVGRTGQLVLPKLVDQKALPNASEPSTS